MFVSMLPVAAYQAAEGSEFIGGLLRIPQVFFLCCSAHYVAVAGVLKMNGH